VTTLTESERNAKLEKKNAEIENGASGRQNRIKQIPEEVMAWLS
jgi:hypothetical protein